MFVRFFKFSLFKFYFLLKLKRIKFFSKILKYFITGAMGGCQSGGCGSNTDIQIVQE